ncbi:unnamed protein product [Calicophoron daubneyi]|uniref:PH domain-containing protein n=1 Tax=Calicophoron daubneyi TaxID=300641 RepID=A0AAV2TUC8_CALDB
MMSAKYGSSISEDLISTEVGLKAPAEETSFIHYGRMYVRIFEEDRRWDPEQSSVGLSGDWMNVSDTETISLYRAALTQSGLLKLIYCDHPEAASENRGGTHRYLHCCIVNLKQISSHSFTLYAVDPDDEKSHLRYRLTCCLPDVQETDKWVERIRLVLSTKPEGPVRTTLPTFCMPLRVAVLNLNTPNMTDYEELCSFIPKAQYKAFISEYCIRLQPLDEQNSHVFIPLEGVVCTKNKSTEKNNYFVLEHECIKYLCATSDRLQFFVITSFLDLWSRSHRLAEIRSIAKSHKTKGKLVEGRLLVGATPGKLEDKQVRISSGTRHFDCLDIYGTFERFDVLKSEMFEKVSPNVYMCHLVAQQILPEFEENRLVDLYVRVPTRKALLKWHRHFNHSPSVFLGILKVITNELQLRSLHTRMKTDSEKGIFSNQNRTPNSVSVQDMAKLMTLPFADLKEILSIPCQWTVSRLEKLLFTVLDHFPQPVLSHDVQHVICKLMSEALEMGVFPTLPLVMAEILLGLSTFNLCVLNLLTTCQFSILRQAKRTELDTMDPVSRLQLMMRHWFPFVHHLCHTKLRNTQPHWKVKLETNVSYFLAAYEYLLQTMLV